MQQQKENGSIILQWYIKNRRTLPWRESKDPYFIWISEIMLQQTRVDTVVDYYHRFIARFPDIRTLAEANEEDVLFAWKGLGYYTRARNIYRAAGIIYKQYGEFPREYDEVIKLPGIGSYTAGAILSIAYDLPFAAVDGNVLRVVARVEGIKESISLATTQKKVKEMVLKMMPDHSAGDFTQAMMELGALICIPGEPLCIKCPVQGNCAAFNLNLQRVLPIVEKKKKPLKKQYVVAIVCDEENILLEYRNKDKLLGNMWGLPMAEKNEQKWPEEAFVLKYGLHLTLKKTVGEITHIFTHQVWEMEVVEYSVMNKSEIWDALQWVNKSELVNLAIPKAFQKVLKLLLPLT